ncbi:hypothetical protein GDO78_012227 [Eleutherodactylus coqui]|uniref:Estradiol 17-beta-dehydrogenase 11 n=1 Tax=Eleutherodactylus coqui TaxID=57060 RepID=A0A8J6K9M9_ELECQ|nr:hypothetical protein GDO78_012227 [Eleutherodactylus coqui]
MNIVLEILLLLLTTIFSYLEALVNLFLPVKRKSVSGEIVLITGAGHGIGRATAAEFAKLQSVLVLWDINKNGVEETAAQCRKIGAKVYTYVVDCSKREDISKAADQTTRAFLPSMMKKNHGHIVTIASLAGSIGVPFLVDYCSTKFAAVGFHKALTAELAALKISGIKMTCLCPTFVDTGFVKNPSSSFSPVLVTEDVAKTLVDGILINKKMICIPSFASLSAVLEVLLPERAQRALNAFQGVKFDAKVRCLDKDKQT